MNRHQNATKKYLSQAFGLRRKGFPIMFICMIPRLRSLSLPIRWRSVSSRELKLRRMPRKLNRPISPERLKEVKRRLSASVYP